MTIEAILPEREPTKKGWIFWRKVVGFFFLDSAIINIKVTCKAVSKENMLCVDVAVGGNPNRTLRTVKLSVHSIHTKLPDKLALAPQLHNSNSIASIIIILV